MTIEISQAADTSFAKAQETAPRQSTRRDHEVIDRIDQTLDLINEATRIAAGHEAVDHFDVSIIVPVFNKLHQLPAVLHRIEEVMPVTTETIVVDEASTDGTRLWLSQVRRRDNLRIIRRRRHYGRGSAVRVGIRHCRGRVIAIQEASLEKDPVDLLRVIWPILDGDADAVFGSHYLDSCGNPSLLNQVTNRLHAAVSNLVSGLDLTDAASGHRAFEAGLLKSIALRECGSGIDAEITAKIANRNARLIEVPTQDHSIGEAKDYAISWKDRLDAIKCMWIHRRS